jgi:hypothetical protein
VLKHCDGRFQIVAARAVSDLLEREARRRLDDGVSWVGVKAWVHEAAHSDYDPDSVVESLRKPEPGAIIDGKYELPRG